MTGACAFSGRTGWAGRRNSGITAVTKDNINSIKIEQQVFALLFDVVLLDCKLSIYASCRPAEIQLGQIFVRFLLEFSAYCRYMYARTKISPCVWCA